MNSAQLAEWLDALAVMFGRPVGLKRQKFDGVSKWVFQIAGSDLGVGETPEDAVDEMFAGRIRAMSEAERQRNIDREQIDRQRRRARQAAARLGGRPLPPEEE